MFGLVQVKSIRRAVPHVGLRCPRPLFCSSREPRLQIGPVGVFLEHIWKIGRRRVLVVVLIHLSPAQAGPYIQRSVGFLGDKIDDCPRCPTAIKGAAGSLHDFNAVDGMQVETFVVQVARHLARHPLTVLQEQHMTSIKSLHGDVVAEGHFLDVQSRCFLLQGVLQIAVSRIDELFSTQDLCRHGRQLDGAFRSRTRHHHVVQMQNILMQDDAHHRVMRLYVTFSGNIANGRYFIIKCFRRFGTNVGIAQAVGHGMSSVGHGSIASHGDTCRFDGLPCSLLAYGQAKGVLGLDRGTTEKGSKFAT